MAFKNFFTPSSRLESLIEKIQQQKSNILITGITKHSKFCCSFYKVALMNWKEKEALIKFIKWYHKVSVESF